MAKVPCPYCYHRINQARLAYVCVGRGIPGGPPKCLRRENTRRREVTGIVEQSFPIFAVGANRLGGTPQFAPCPHCRGETGVRACPECHTPVSATFAESRSPMVGIVGGKGAGKTVYTAVLHHELRTTVRRRFRADIRLTGDMQGGTGSAMQWLEFNEDQLFNDGKLFETTASAAGGMRAPVVIEWRQPTTRFGRTTFGTTVLSFYDAAGEDLTSAASVHTQAYIGVAEGLILLLDPWQLPGARDRIAVPDAVIKESAPPLGVLTAITDTLRTTHKVRNRHSIPVPLAVVFAKIDEFFGVLEEGNPLLARPASPAGCYDEVNGQTTHEHVKAMLHEFRADDIDSLLAANYSTYRYFAVSSLGTPPDYSINVVNSSGVHPFRVEEPLLWLLSRFGVIGRCRA